MAKRTIDIQIGSKFKGGGINSAMKALRSLTKGATDIKSAFGMVFGVVQKFYSTASSVIGSAFKFETQTRQFKTLIGNIDEAKAHMADLKALGDTPPFNLEQFAQASRSLMVMTDGALGYKKSLEMIGDAAAATGVPIETMGHAVGRLYAFIRDGQPLGLATRELRNMGVVTPEVAAKLEEMRKAGASNVEIWGELVKSLSRFEGAMKETESTGEGLIGAIKSRWDNIVRAIGNAFEDTAKDGMGEVLSAMDELEQSGAVESWANATVEALNRVVGAAKTVGGWFGKIWDHLSEGREAWKEMGQEAAEARGDAESFEFDREEAINAYTRKRYYKGSDGSERVEVIEDIAAKKKYEREQREQERLAREKEREEREAARIAESLAEGQRRIDEKNAKEAEEKRIEAEKKAAELAAKERDRLERELHQKRMKDLHAEIDAQKTAETGLRNVAAAAQSEFDRAFAMYRDPAQATSQIAEERDYAADLKRLHRDANRYGGKWRIDELSRLMSAGDSQGVSDTLESWRKVKGFSPEVEAMVRASAAEKTKTTAEDELRKIESNTADLAAKLDELISMKG